MAEVCPSSSQEIGESFSSLLVEHKYNHVELFRKIGQIIEPSPEEEESELKCHIREWSEPLDVFSEAFVSSLLMEIEERRMRNVCLLACIIQKMSLHGGFEGSSGDVKYISGLLNGLVEGLKELSECIVKTAPVMQAMNEILDSLTLLLEEYESQFSFLTSSVQNLFSVTVQMMSSGSEFLNKAILIPILYQLYFVASRENFCLQLFLKNGKIYSKMKSILGKVGLQEQFIVIMFAIQSFQRSSQLRLKFSKQFLDGHEWKSLCNKQFDKISAKEIRSVLCCINQPKSCDDVVNFSVQTSALKIKSSGSGVFIFKPTPLLPCWIDFNTGEKKIVLGEFFDPSSPFGPSEITKMFLLESELESWALKLSSMGTCQLELNVSECSKEISDRWNNFIDVPNSSVHSNLASCEIDFGNISEGHGRILEMALSKALTRQKQKCLSVWSNRCSETANMIKLPLPRKLVLDSSPDSFIDSPAELKEIVHTPLDEETSPLGIKPGVNNPLKSQNDDEQARNSDVTMSKNSPEIAFAIRTRLKDVMVKAEELGVPNIVSADKSGRSKSSLDHAELNGESVAHDPYAYNQSSDNKYDTNKLTSPQTTGLNDIQEEAQDGSPASLEKPLRSKRLSSESANEENEKTPPQQRRSKRLRGKKKNKRTATSKSKKGKGVSKAMQRKSPTPKSISQGPRTSTSKPISKPAQVQKGSKSEQGPSNCATGKEKDSLNSISDKGEYEKSKKKTEVAIPLESDKVSDRVDGVEDGKKMQTCGGVCETQTPQSSPPRRGVEKMVSSLGGDLKMCIGRKQNAVREGVERCFDACKSDIMEYFEEVFSRKQNADESKELVQKAHSLLHDIERKQTMLMEYVRDTTEHQAKHTKELQRIIERLEAQGMGHVQSVSCQHGKVCQKVLSIVHGHFQSIMKDMSIGGSKTPELENLRKSILTMVEPFL
eukprot:Nk52_evm48s266 gene=Nk52_evmTU48s266